MSAGKNACAHDVRADRARLIRVGAIMAGVMALLGRILLALIFIISGISKIGGYAGTVAYMQAKGMPVAPLFLYAAVLIEIGGGLSLATGFRGRIGALVLLLFMIPTTYLFHFKAAFDANFIMIDRGQMTQAMKNLAIMGGLMFIWASGCGKLTIGKDS